ncbi:peritrophin-1 [Solenopsis invicta]|uniref:peritrophin-1 n=1 Tax=Solenopsis invicta TaxID=13686 RepID=UPI000595BE9E|nr:peritrophin-1 [Solenopsis invicta]
MKGYYSVIIALTLVVLGVSASRIPRSFIKEPECPQSGKIKVPYPELCTDKYFICENGKPTISECPEGLHFIENLQICDFPLKECYPDKPIPQIIDNSDIHSAPILKI